MPRQFSVYLATAPLFTIYLLLCSCSNRWPDIADGFNANLFPVKGDKTICSPDLTFE